MRQAAVIGIASDAFWQMTPRWVLALIEAHEDARAKVMRFDATVAWLTAAWPRMKRMPELSRVLDQLGLASPSAAPRQQTAEEMFAAGQLWAARSNAMPKRAAPTRRARLASLDRWRAAQGKAAGEQ